MPVSKKINCELNIDKLKPFDKNPRMHSHEQVNQLADFIKSIGYIDPVIVDESNTILAGHGRVLAAMMLEMSTIPCIKVHGLTDIEKKAYVVADNKLALNASWDDSYLTEFLTEIKDSDFNLDLLGFSSIEISQIIESSRFSDIKNSSDELSTSDFDSFDHKCPKCGFEWNKK